MRFACIVYNTHSGSIWRPTPERPNYLCDNKREIDAASFGTWVSALQGEYIPLKWLIDGKQDYPLYKNKNIILKIVDKLKRDYFQKKIKFNNLRYLEKFDVVLVCHNFLYHKNMLDFLLQAKKSFKDILFIGALPYNLGRVREFWRDSAWYESFVSFFNTVDIFTSIDYVAKDYYSLVIKKPVIYFPTFYPVEYTKKIIQRDKAKEKIIFVAGDTKRLDIIWGMHIAKRIQQIFPEYLIQFIKTDKFNVEPLKGARYEALPPMSWLEFLKTINRSKLVINTDIWWTNGRIPADCAAVGTPCLGVNAHRQIELFPELVCEDISGTKKAIDLGCRLIQDNMFYEKIRKESFKKLECYSYENSAQQFKRLINMYNQGRINEWRDESWLNSEVQK